ncbi:MAG: replicative DNA helicase [Candidatus Westeberhardia cardiocondylae]|nr:replicative DNA helicase [Candidatus Westeberhardia cardiocondylae]
MQYNFHQKKTTIKDKEINQLKIPPHSLEAEQSVLGGLMLDNNKWDDIIEKINNNNFFSYSHQLIFKEMQYLAKIGKPIDLITLSESLEKKGILAKIGGFSYLAELSKNTPSAANISAYADIVRERSIIREIISTANEIAEAGYNPKGKNAEDILDFSESKIFQIAEHQLNKNTGPKHINTILNKTVKHIEKLYKQPYNTGITGISCGYQDIDKKTSGLQKSDLIIIAARPAMGKTTLAINFCENISMTEKKPALIFSLEMSNEQIMIKILSSLSRVNQTQIRTGKLNNEDWIRIYNTIKTLLKKNNMYIDDSSELTPITLRSRARKIFRENGGLSVIMVDYLQLMRVPTLSYNRTSEITEISRSLKGLAKELKVPIIALSQLNRSLEQRSDKRPINSDLRESGSIEQDADLIMFIYRDELYNTESSMKGIAEIILSKQRNGPIGTIRLTFNGQWSRFDNYYQHIK